MEERTCLDCGKPITVGRADKKFCNDPCRTNYNNRHLQDQKKSTDGPDPEIPEFVNKIIAILEKNRQILFDIVGPDKETTSRPKRDVMGLGYNFKYMTGREVMKNGEVYYFAFEMGYKELDNDYIMIVKRPREVIC